MVEARVRAAFGGLNDDARAAAAAVGVEVARAIVPRLKALLALDIDEQSTTPLALVREAVPIATAALRTLGVPPVRRDAFRSDRFPDDEFDLVPANLATLGEETGELAIIWGAAKAFTHKARHAAGPAE
jgi:hypothetical protein